MMVSVHKVKKWCRRETVNGRWVTKKIYRPEIVKVDFGSEKEHV